MGSSQSISNFPRSTMPPMLIDVNGTSIPNPEWTSRMKEIWEKHEQRRKELMVSQ